MNVNIIKDKITDYRYYFFVFTEYHKLSLKEINDTVINNDFYDIYNKFTSENKKEVEDYLFKFEKRQFIYLNSYLKSLSSSKKYIFKLIHFYKYLLDGIQKLVNINIVHGNIQFNNLLIDTFNDNSIYLTDFRYSIKIQKDSSILDTINFQEFKPAENLELPIEFHILSYMLTHKIKSLSRYNIHNIIDIIYKDNTILKTFGDTIYNSYIDQAKEYYSKYVNKTIENIWVDISSWFYTWDNYSLSVVYLKILISLYNYLKNEKSITNNKFLISFMNLLVVNIHPNPNKRKNIFETQELFDNIIYSCNLDVYKELINNI
jgi:hypothetical protein